MPKYQYKGVPRTFPSLGITVKDGDTFEGPAGLRGQGISLVTSFEEKTAPAVKEKPIVEKTIEKEVHKTSSEQPKEQIKVEPSASSDISAGA